MDFFQYNPNLEPSHFFIPAFREDTLCPGHFDRQMSLSKPNRSIGYVQFMLINTRWNCLFRR